MDSEENGNVARRDAEDRRTVESTVETYLSVTESTSASRASGRCEFLGAWGSNSHWETGAIYS